MSVYTLRFDDAPSTSSQVSYSLVELPTAFISPDNVDVLSTLVIKGQPSDDAVLCTSSSTYNIRAVKNSNSLLLCRPSKGKKLDIQNTLHQTLELEITVPKLDRLSGLLKGQEWDPEEVGEDNPKVSIINASSSVSALIVCTYRKRKRIKRCSKDNILDVVPASNTQVEAALVERRILQIGGDCFPLSPGSLIALLKNILTTLASLLATPASFDLEELAKNLKKDDNIPEEVTIQIAEWFGSSNEDRSWRLELKYIAREIGKEILAGHKNTPIAMTEFMESWKEALGEQFSNVCDISLLAGICLVSDAKRSLGSGATLMYYPISALPLDPASRFSDLFSIKQRWRLDEIAPFLADLAIDSKKRDALTLKFTRKVKDDKGETFYAARAR